MIKILFEFFIKNKIFQFMGENFTKQIEPEMEKS